MAPQLLQVKVDPVLKADLQEIADYKGIPMTSFIKMTLTAVVRKEKQEMFTENGLTEGVRFYKNKKEFGLHFPHGIDPDVLISAIKKIDG